MANEFNFKEVVQVDFLAGLDVDPVSVHDRCNDVVSFIIRHSKLCGHLPDLVLELVDRLDFLGQVVQGEDLLLLNKDDLIWLAITVDILKVILHANLIEEGDVFDNYPFDKFEIVIGVVTLGALSLEHEKLVLFLLIFNEIFSTYDCEIVLTLRLLHADDFIWLSCLCLKQGNWDLSNCLEVV